MLDVSDIDVEQREQLEWTSRFEVKFQTVTHTHTKSEANDHWASFTCFIVFDIVYVFIYGNQRTYINILLIWIVLFVFLLFFCCCFEFS